MVGTGDGRDAVSTAGLLCGSCGTELPPDSRFCNQCGAPVRPAPTAAEYKQVTELLADVVHTMDIAAAVGAERLRESMAELLDRSMVETLLDRGADGDMAEAAIGRLAEASADEGLVVREIWLLRLRALLARAHGEDARYREYLHRYRDMAKTLGFEGHIAWAEEMP